MEMSSLSIRSIADFDYAGKTVLLRVDINSPVDEKTGSLRNTNRIDKSVPTFKHLTEQGAKLAVIAHQGDSQDYKSLIPLSEHAKRLGELLGRSVKYIDDVCGPAAQDAIRALAPGEVVLLGNLRYLAEEISAFELALKLPPEKYLNCYLVRSLAPLVDAYVNDAFAAAHRNSPSMVAFQEILPSAAGFLLFDEVSALSRVLESPAQPAVYLLGGNRISDAYGMMGQVLTNGSAAGILTSGVVGLVMLLALGSRLGANAEQYIKDRNYNDYIPESQRLLREFGDKIRLPVDLAVEENGQRKEIPVSALPVNQDIFDIGEQTITAYEQAVASAGTVFLNGPAGVYETPIFEKGTQRLFEAVQNSPAYTVIGGGDSVAAAAKYIDANKISHVCTAGGAMVQYLSGEEMPLIKAMKKAARNL